MTRVLGREGVMKVKKREMERLIRTWLDASIYATNRGVETGGQSGYEASNAWAVAARELATVCGIDADKIALECFYVEWWRFPLGERPTTAGEMTSDALKSVYAGSAMKDTAQVAR